MKQKTVVILGGGMGGIVAANVLKKKAGDKARVILIDKSHMHIYAPAFLYLMLGKRQPNKIQKSLSLLKRKGIEFINEEAVKIDPEHKTVKAGAQNFQYDYLIISLGAESVPEKIPSLVKSGYNLHELKDMEKLRDDLKSFSGGKVAIVISSLPFKCPAAPYEAAFLLDEYFRRKAIRDKVEISIFTPEALPMPSAGPEIGRAVMGMVEERGIKFNPEVKLALVDPNVKTLMFENGINASFDLLVFIPPHQGPKVIRDSAIGNEMGWIPVDGKTLATEYDSVFAIGDNVLITIASGKQLPKAGVFAHFEAKVVAENIVNKIKGIRTNKEYDGRSYCFLELGFGKAGIAYGNFYTVPAPMIKMKKPGRLWHWGKILFEKYWLWKWFS